MASEVVSEPSSFIDKVINRGIGYLKNFGDKSSSTGTAVKESVKLLRWWCNCKTSNNAVGNELLNESKIGENLKNGMNEAMNVVKNVTENISQVIPESEAIIIDENTQTLLSTLIKLGVILLFIGCVLYVLSGIRRKIINYRTSSGITDNSKMTSLVISKNQEFQEGDVFFKQQKLQNSLTVLTPIVSQKTSPFTPVNSKEFGKRPQNSNEKLLRKAVSSPKNAETEMIVAPIHCLSPGNGNITDRTQRDASSPARTDRTQNGVSSPARTDPTQDFHSSPARTDRTQKSSSPTNNNSFSSSLLTSEIPHYKI
uniref:Uncharacterized protein n=1 Tax=Panagrolaimus superbus TaxID=310955 RepID=A0A914Z2Z7_9BILA